MQALHAPGKESGLEPIRTPHYFLPAIDEGLASNPGPDYVGYLAARLAPFVRAKEETLVAGYAVVRIPRFLMAANTVRGVVV